MRDFIPNDVTIKLRVDNPYQLATGNGQYNEYPTYRFELEGISSTEEPLSNASSSSLALILQQIQLQLAPGLIGEEIYT
jgi:hypothetical protein